MLSFGRAAAVAFRRALAGAATLGLVLALAGLARADDDVMLQGFYWDCPQGWYDNVRQHAAELQRAGFTAIWLPPPSKGASGAQSMGYDVFDHYDIGEYDQKGSIPTHFGTFTQLKQCVDEIHARRMKAYADIVLNQLTGGDLEFNPITQQNSWTKFTYPHHTFEKTYADFHPSNEHPDNDPPYHNNAFGQDLCQMHDHVNKGLKTWGDWLTNRVGYDGYRLDFAKGIDPNYIADWLNAGAMQGKFAVSEFWDGDVGAVDQFVQSQGGRTSAFDFPLFYTLKAMCNDTSGGFDMSQLDGAGYAARNPMKSVTFCENHDTDRSDPIRTDKMMAYAFILTMEGYPCVFWKDYYVYNLKSKIDPLIAIRKKLCGGTTTTLWKDPDLFIAERNGTANLSGCVLVLNDDATSWKGTWVTVKTAWAGKDLKDWTGQAQTKHVANDGRVELWAPPRGYAIYAPAGAAAPGRVNPSHARRMLGPVGTIPGPP